MPVAHARIHYLGQVYSPFSGLPADGDGGPNKADSTLLFVYYGDAGDFAYIAQRIRNDLTDAEGTDPESLATALNIDGGIILEVDTDWNGINWYGFAPTA